MVARAHPWASSRGTRRESRSRSRKEQEHYLGQHAKRTRADSDSSLAARSGPEPTTDDPQTGIWRALLVGTALGALLTLMIALLRRTPAALEGLPRPKAAQREAHPLGGASVVAGRVATASHHQVARPAHSAVPPLGLAPDGATGPGRWPAATKYVVGVILFLAVLALLYFMRSVLQILVLAALIAFVVSPVVRLLERALKGRRGLAVALTYLLVTVALILIPVILIPTVINAVNDLIAVDYQGILGQAATSVERWSAQAKAMPIAGEILGPVLDSILATLRAATTAPHPEEVSVSVTLAEASDRLARALGLLTQVLGPVVSAVASLVFMVLIALYISMTAHQMKDWLRPLVPPDYEGEVMGCSRGSARSGLPSWAASWP
jgi:hypothetical protein